VIDPPLVVRSSVVPSVNSISRAIARGMITATLPPSFFIVTVIANFV
jgi:hypothetical protein